jgi:glutaconate CoA-transferase subunit A
MDKQISIEEAAALVPSGCMIAFGGMTIYRRPMAFVRALIDRYRIKGEPKELTLLAFTAGIESDWMVGSGMISQVHSCYFGLEVFGLAPMFTYFANRGEIKIVEETEASLALGLRACLAGIGFMPGRAWQGTDLPKLRPDVVSVTDPYSGEKLIAFPAICPDIAIIHALKADPSGNALIGDNKGIDEELSLASKIVIITAEEIVPTLEKADLVSPCVHAVVLAPKGAVPTSCHPLYPIHGEKILAYTEQVSDPQSFQKYMDSFT